jgi:hypothetical protein
MATTKTKSKVSKRVATKPAKAMAIPAIKPQGRVPVATTKMVRARWEEWRADHILSIMQTDGIDYVRAVKRSRRRLHNAGEWN